MGQKRRLLGRGQKARERPGPAAQTTNPKPSPGRLHVQLPRRSRSRRVSRETLFMQTASSPRPRLLEVFPQPMPRRTPRQSHGEERPGNGPSEGKAWRHRGHRTRAPTRWRPNPTCGQRGRPRPEAGWAPPASLLPPVLSHVKSLKLGECRKGNADICDKCLEHRVSSPALGLLRASPLQMLRTQNQPRGQGHGAGRRARGRAPGTA